MAPDISLFTGAQTARGGRWRGVAALVVGSGSSNINRPSRLGGGGSSKYNNNTAVMGRTG